MAHLFKYVTAETGCKIIENRTLRWSTPSTLNDPFDMQFAFQLRIDRQAARAMALEKQWQHLYGEASDRPLNNLGVIIRQRRVVFPSLRREEFNREMGPAIDESFERVEQKMSRFNEWVQSQFANDKIFCLSDKPDIIPMWSYYAQNHSGLVLRFTDETPNNPLAMARRVRYSEQMPSLFNDEMLSDMLAGYSGIDAERIRAEVVWTKSIHWSHEREWRVYAGAGRSTAPHEDIPFNAHELDGVIFGVRATDSVKTRIGAAVRTLYPHAEILQTRPIIDAYELAIERVQ